MGIFWPRAIEFIVSIAEIPVEIISSGYTYVDLAHVAYVEVDYPSYSRVGVDGTTVDVEVVLCKHLGTLINGSA